jgi:hypothetical protein
MAENLERDKRSRTAHKPHARRIISETNELFTIFDERKLEHREKYKHYKSTLERKRDVINDLDKSILKGTRRLLRRSHWPENGNFRGTGCNV